MVPQTSLGPFWVLYFAAVDSGLSNPLVYENSSLRFTSLGSYPIYATWKDCWGKPHFRISLCLTRIFHFLSFSGLLSCGGTSCTESQLGVWARDLPELLTGLTSLSNASCLSGVKLGPCLIYCYISPTALSFFILCICAQIHFAFVCIFCQPQSSMPLRIVARLYEPGPQVWSWYGPEELWLSFHTWSSLISVSTCLKENYPLFLPQTLFIFFMPYFSWGHYNYTL